MHTQIMQFVSARPLYRLLVCQAGIMYTLRSDNSLAVMPVVHHVVDPGMSWSVVCVVKQLACLLVADSIWQPMCCTADTCSRGVRCEPLCFQDSCMRLLEDCVHRPRVCVTASTGLGVYGSVKKLVAYN
jgi:hypothetical protein